MAAPHVVSPAVLTPVFDVPPADAFSLRMERAPDTIIGEAQLTSQALMAAVKRNGWAINLGGKKDHLYFEAWAFLASMYRVTARVRPEATKLIEFGDVTGFEATAEAFHARSGAILSCATSMCMDDEENWDTRPVKEYDEKLKKRVVVGTRDVPLFQLRSMAETRACAKVLRLVFSSVVAMAGFEVTPKEEMKGTERGTQPQPKEPQEKQAAGGKRLITERMASRIWAIAYSAGVDKKDVPKILKHYGFETAEQVTTDKYDEICSFFERGAK